MQRQAGVGVSIARKREAAQKSKAGSQTPYYRGSELRTGPLKKSPSSSRGDECTPFFWTARTNPLSMA